MALNSVVNYADARSILFPCTGGGANLPMGTLMMPGVTAGTNLGVLRAVTAASNADVLGILAEPHNFAVQGDATTATLVQWFYTEGFASQQNSLGLPAIYPNGLPSHQVALVDTAVLAKIDYAVTAAYSGQAPTAMTVTTMTGTTVINNAGFQAGFDSAFVYFSVGTAIGQLGFIKSSIASTSATLVSALTTTPVAADTMVLINPLFYSLPTWLINTSTQQTLVDSNVAAGTGTAAQIASFMVRNGNSNRLDPKIFHKTTGLNALSQLGFYGLWAFQDTIFHPGS